MAEATIAIGVILLLVWLLVIGYLVKQAHSLMIDRYGVMSYVFFPLKMIVTMCCIIDAVILGIVQGQWWLYNVGTSNVAVVSSVFSGGLLRPWVLLGVAFLLDSTLSGLIKSNRRRQQQEDGQDEPRHDAPGVIKCSDNRVVLSLNGQPNQGEFAIPPPGFDEGQQYPRGYSSVQVANDAPPQTDHAIGRSQSRGGESSGGASSNGPTTTGGTRGPGSNESPQSGGSPMQTPRFDRDSLDLGAHQLPPLSGGRLPSAGSANGPASTTTPRGNVVSPLVVDRKIIFNERGEIEISMVPVLHQQQQQQPGGGSGSNRPGTAGSGGGGGSNTTTPRGYEERGGRLGQPQSSTPDVSTALGGLGTPQQHGGLGSRGLDSNHVDGAFDSVAPVPGPSYPRRDNYNNSRESDVGLGLGFGSRGFGGLNGESAEGNGFEYGGNGVAPVHTVDPTSFWYVPARRYLTLKASRRWVLAIFCWFLLHIVFAVVERGEAPSQPPLCEASVGVNLNLVSCRTNVSESRFRWMPPRVFAILQFLFHIAAMALMLRAGMKHSKKLLHRPTQEQFHKMYLVLLTIVTVNLVFAMIHCTDAGRRGWATGVVCGFDNAISMFLYICIVRRMVGLSGA